MLQQPQPAPQLAAQHEPGRPREPLPPCAALFISGLPVAVPGAGWKRPLEKGFGRFSARGKPRVRIARNTFNNAVGHGWIENVLLERASEAVAALDGELKIDGQPVAVSLCVDHRDALCPKLSYAARKQLVLAPAIVDSSRFEPLDQPNAERIAELLLLFAAVGWNGTGCGKLPPAVQVLHISAGEGLGTAVFASTFAAVHAVESDPLRYAALESNFTVADSSHGGATTGSLASISCVGRIQLHRTLADGIAASSAEPRVPVFGFFQNSTEPGSTADSKSGGCAQVVASFRTLLDAGCDVVAALLPISVDFDTVAAALVRPPASAGPTDERPHPFKLEFLRPSYTAKDSPRSGLWQDWQLILVTAALPSPYPPPAPAARSPEMAFGNARLDALVAAVLGFYGKYCKEHRPFFYDWEKQRTIQLSRWKGAKLASDHNGLTLRELRAAQSQPETQSSDDAAATTDVEQKPEHTTSSGVGAVFSEPQVRQCRLVWVLIVDGGTCDRKAGTSRKASWVGFDKGYRLRRDALARSVTAALWANPASTADCDATQVLDGQQKGDEAGPPRSVHGDSECHIIHEQTGELLSISSEFAQSWRRGGPPTEARLLKAFDDAVRDASSAGGPGSTDKFVPGLTVHTDTTTVAEATARILTTSGLSTLHRSSNVAGKGARRCAVIELHEDKDRFLPVYGAPSLVDQAHNKLDAVSLSHSLPQLDALMMVLGCVQDHSDAVATVVETCLSAPDPSDTASCVVGDLEANAICGGGTRLHLAVNVGPVSEFSSKVIHLLQAHHTANRLLPAVTMQLQLLRDEFDPSPVERDVQTARHVRLENLATAAAAAAVAAATAGDGGDNDDATTTAGVDGKRIHRQLGSPVVAFAGGAHNHPKQVPLHFWVWCDGVRLAHLPTTQECKRVANPILASKHRSTVWRVPNVVLATFARSHGAYDNVKLSLVLEDGVVTVDGTLVTKHITERGWGALTEHHTLVALRDAIDAASPTAPVLADSFEQAIRQATSSDAPGGESGGGAGGAAATSGDGGAGNKHRFVLLTDEEEQGRSKHSLAQGLYCHPADRYTTVDVAQPCATSSTQDQYHFVLLPPPQLLRASEVEAAIQNCVGGHNGSAINVAKSHHVVRCSTEALSPTGAAEPVRMIVALQAHNNCGALSPAVDEVFEIVGMQQ